MTKNEYEETMYRVKTMPEYFRWELIKVLWEIRDVIKGGLDE